MSSPPWERDTPLTLDTARAVVRVALPSVAAEPLEFLGSGWEFDAFVTADGWVFRFPRRADAERLFEREGPILESPEHLVTNAETGCLVGILDWTDAILGDPARVWVKNAFTEETPPEECLGG